MPSQLSAFAINADDVSRARQFYEKVFAWKFQPWGPPDFYLIEAGGGVTGLLQERRELIKGSRMIGFECTISVKDIDQTIKDVTANNGKIAMPKFHIPTVGTGCYFIDPEGNVAGAMQQENASR